MEFTTAIKEGDIDRLSDLYWRKRVTLSDLSHGIYIAVKHNHKDVVEWLLRLGGSPKIMTDLPLRYACSKGYTEIVDLLIQYGADIRAKNYEGVIAAVKCGRFDTLEYLLDRYNRSDILPYINDGLICPALGTDYADYKKCYSYMYNES